MRKLKGISSSAQREEYILFEGETKNTKFVQNVQSLAHMTFLKATLFNLFSTY